MSANRLLTKVRHNRLGLILVAFFVSAAGALGATCCTWIERSHRRDFVQRTQALAGLLAHNLEELERSANAVGANASRVLYELDASFPALLDAARLRVLATELQVEGLHVLRADGAVLASSNPQAPRLAGLCATRLELLHGSTPDITPFLPSLYEAAQKYITRVSFDQQRLLQVTMSRKALRHSLAAVVQHHADILAATLHSAEGLDLQDALTPQACVALGRSTPYWPAYAQEGGRLVVHTQVAASPNTCQQRRAFYRLRLEVDDQTVRRAIAQGRARVGYGLGLTALASLALSVWLVGTRRQMRAALQGAQAAGLSSVAHLATQVAHDMRSPLSAINLVLDDLDRPSDDTRALLRSAVYRLQDIANELMARHRAADERPNTSHGSEPILVASLVDAVVSEKRRQWRQKIDVEIVCSAAAEAYGRFAPAQAAALPQVLGDLIDQAVQAMPGRGRVTVQLQGNGSCLRLHVGDDGHHLVPPQDGQAWRDPAAEWGGELTWEEAGKASLTVPCAPAPEWFLHTLDLTGIGTVVVLDDDASVHGIWTQRLAAAVTLVHLSTPDALRQWVQASPANERVTVCFLVDYELLTFAETGLDLVEALELSPQSVLVTGRFEEAAVLDRLRQLRMRLIPKPLAAHIPVLLPPPPPPRPPDCILVDDDALGRKAARRADKELAIFKNPQALLAKLDELPRHTPIYVDADLGRQMRGEKVTRLLAEAGFACLYLATGFAHLRHSDMPWLKGVRGKDPPF